MWYHNFYFATHKDAERASRSSYFECSGRQVCPLDEERALLQVITPSPYSEAMGDAIAFQIGAEAHVINSAEDRQLSTVNHLLLQASTIAMNLSPVSASRQTYELMRHYRELTKALRRIGMDV